MLFSRFDKLPANDYHTWMNLVNGTNHSAVSRKCTWRRRVKPNCLVDSKKFVWRRVKPNRCVLILGNVPGEALNLTVVC